MRGIWAGLGELMFAKLADVIHSHSKAIIVVWLAVLICSLPLALQASDVLEYDMTNMSGADTEASEGQQILNDYFVQISMDEIVVASYSSQAQFQALYDESNPSDSSTFFGIFSNDMSERYPNLTVQYGGFYQKDTSSDSGIILIAISSADSSYDLTHQTGHIRDIVSDAKAGMSSYNDFSVYVTGSDAISYDTEASSMEDVSKVDPLSIALIFVLLALFFYALVTAFVPPAVVGMAYGVTLTLVWAVGQVLGIYYITQTLLLVVMLGAGCDYSIFIITRYRDERKKGKSHDEALREAVMWGGESVATSGISVMIGFAALTLCSFSLVQTMGIVLALGILIALIAALTFIPSLINIAGEKIFWPRNIDKYKDADAKADSKDKGVKKGVHGHLVSFGRRYFGWLAKFTHKHAVPVAIVFVLLCIPTTYVYATAEDSSDIISIMPDSESIDGLNLIMTEADGGTIMPNYLTIELKDPIAEVGTSFTSTSGSVSLGYIVPNSSYAGVVADLTAMSTKIQSDYSDIVGSVSSLNSWQTIYDQALAQANATMKTSVDDTIKQGIATAQGIEVSAVTDAMVQQYIATRLAAQGIEANETTIQAFYTTQITNAIKQQIATAQGIDVSAVTDDMVSATVASQVNHGIQTQMKTVSPTGAEVVLLVFTQMSAASGQDAWGLAADQQLGVSSTSGDKVTMANVMDYYLNVRTGLLSQDAKYVSLTIITNEKPMSNNTMDFIKDLRSDMTKDGGYLDEYSSSFSDSWVSGSSALMNDIGDVVEEQFSFIRIVVIVLLILLLFVILGCYVTPIRAIITIVMSVIWATALTHVVFEDMLDTPVLFLIPIVLFVVLLGLGMDYEIFLTTKIRENRIKGMDNDTAIEEAVRQAGGVISLCALIMGGTFLTLLLAGSSMLQEFGFALGIGILIDGLVMVGFVSPSLMHILGEWSWKGPKFLARRNPQPKAASAVDSDAEEKQ